MGICGNSLGVFDIQNECVRNSWTAVVPVGFVLALCLLSTLRATVKPPAWSPFKRFLTIQEAETLVYAVDSTRGDELRTTTTTTPAKGDDMSGEKIRFRSIVMIFIGLLQAGCWTALSSFRLYALFSSSYEVGGSQGHAMWKAVRPLLFAATWVYTVVRRIRRPTLTAPIDLFVVYVVLLVSGVVEFGGLLYGSSLQGLPEPSTLVLVGYSLNLTAIVVCLGVVLWMPLAVPGEGVPRNEIGKTISTEDYTTLWGWISFTWIYPLVSLGKSTTLNEWDVWNLSPTFQSRPLFQKFVGTATESDTKKPTLLRRIVKLSSVDLMLDASLAIVNVCLSYSNPFFLKSILLSIDKPADQVTPSDRSNAYIYACLMFLSCLAKAQADVNRLWFGRRAATRIHSMLIACIYDKALKRKEATAAGGSGAKSKSKADTDVDYDGQSGEEEEIVKGSADAGKVVNLMSGDVVTIRTIVIGMSKIWGTPLELILGFTYLYQLLGWSSITGYLVLLAGWPLNSLLSKHTIRIKKGLSSATDTRIRLLNELLKGVKFVKFFAWEGPWIERVMGAREKEMARIVESRINSILFSLLWMSSPILVSIVSFATYVFQGNELTVSTAFTAIALFGMIRQPLNVLPTLVVDLLNTRVAFDRISSFLEEPEVDERVSTLKAQAAAARREPRLSGEEHGLGFRNATLKWSEHEVELGEKPKKHKAPEVPVLRRSSSWFGTFKSRRPADDGVPNVEPEPSSPAIVVSVVKSVGSGRERSADSKSDHRFELKDISVMFPEGKLTVVTGPTASGKTALLMAVLGEMTVLSGEVVLHKDPRRLVHLDDGSGRDEKYMETISYASQSPWLRHQTIKENILFGYPFDAKRYRQVVEACALLPDFGILEDGDETEIGAGGVSLSGGQKARVALARAVYARTKYVLLDDPLSAVDSHTSRYLFERLLCGPLLRGRTVVLVTHHVDLVLPGAHYLVRMLDGRIDMQGTVKDLRDQGSLEGIASAAGLEAYHRSVVAKKREKRSRKDTVGSSEETKKPGRKLVEDEQKQTGSVKWKIYQKYLEASSYYIWIVLALLVVMNQFLGVGEKLWMMQWGQAYRDAESEDLVLSTATSTLTSAFRAFPMGSPGSGTSEHAYAADSYVYWQQHLHQVHSVHSDPNRSVAHGFSTTGSTPGGGGGGSDEGLFGIQWPSAHEHPLFYVGIYAAIGLGNVLVNICSVVAQYTGALRASRLLFRQLLEKVVRATFRFHDTTPQGRILNRFGKDIETIDSSLASSLQAVNMSLAGFFASVITITVVFPFFILPATVFGFIYRALAIAYLNTGRDLRRMEANARSPVYSHFGELLEGIVTIRAFSAENQFLDGLHTKVDQSMKYFYMFWMTNRWLLLNFDCISGLLVFITALFSISRTDNSAAGIAGLCISSALSFTNAVYWACRYWTNLELDLNSVERVIEYLEVPQEPPAVIESNRPPAYWPSSNPNNHSLIRVENLCVKYAPELPDVLRDVSFSLRAGERVGLLGRTGSGKSTLAMSILRFVDPSSGKIFIDGVDISAIGTYDLRSRLTFIPQDATLFSGTLRENLDPFNEHTDEECLDVLYRVQVIHPEHDMISRRSSRRSSRIPSAATSRTSSVHGDDATRTITSEDSDYASSTDVESRYSNTISLYTEVNSGGSNFSQGQRQLISIARALLRKSPVIVLDEATSSIDFATDEKIQKAIREEFGESLLLTVAHRLRTVIDYDRLIVLDKGRMMEFDTPWNLIQKQDGIFRDMCMKSGTFSELEAAAKVKQDDLSVPGGGR
ncbi:P-loop containing nucleoside triphosphate hydrolase protein [Marasmius fiardii PR-910]|nr:P-loop containing nucleoside triphosphate hydrolase protein [Marasmius fiardii PR-910]